MTSRGFLILQSRSLHLPIGSRRGRKLQRSDSTKPAIWIQNPQQLSQKMHQPSQKQIACLCSHSKRRRTESRCSQNNIRLRNKGPLHLKVFINQSGGWRNEETQEFKDGTEYEPKAEPTDPYDELPNLDCEWMRLRSDSWWNDFFAWRSEVMNKQKTKNLTEEDQAEWKRRIEGYKEASIS
jgi:hypothetical protein